VTVEQSFVDVRDEVWILLQRGERRQAALKFIDRFYEISHQGNQVEFLKSRIFVDLSVELSDVILDDEFNEEIARRRAAYQERVQKEKQQQ
jgi:hypothetical protein